MQTSQLNRRSISTWTNLRAKRENRSALRFLTPWLIGLGLMTAGPMLASLALSFTDFNLLSAPSWVGLENYQRMFTQDPRFIKSIEVTTTYVLISVPLAVAVALLVAVLLNQKVRWLGFFRSAYYLPSLLGGSVAIAILWRQIFGNEGLINNLLATIGIDGPGWITTPEYAVWSLIFLHVWQFGSPMVIFLAGLKQVPIELKEAASMDGAGTLRVFFVITLPLLTPLILFNLVMQTITSFQAFAPAFIISGGSGGPVDSTLFYTLYIYLEGFGKLRMGYASAMAWVLLLIIAVFTALLFFSSRRWVFYQDGGNS